MRLHKTGHAIADTVSDLIGEVPDGEYNIAYGILRHELFQGSDRYFEVDKGFWGASHYDGNYRLSFCGTQPKYHDDGPVKPHGLTLEPWRSGRLCLICPPTEHAAQFFGIDRNKWINDALDWSFNAMWFPLLREKGDDAEIPWDDIGLLKTFNSSLGFEALRRGIRTISDPNHSTIGTYVKQKGIDGIDREELFSFAAGHMFTLDDKETVNCLISHYLSGSDTMPARP